MKMRLGVLTLSATVLLVSSCEAPPRGQSITPRHSEISLQEKSPSQKEQGSNAGFLVEVASIKNPMVDGDGKRAGDVIFRSLESEGIWYICGGSVVWFIDVHPRDADRARKLIVAAITDQHIKAKVIDNHEKMKDTPNQPPLRMPVSGTPAADAPVAPPPGIAGR